MKTIIALKRGLLLTALLTVSAVAFSQCYWGKSKAATISAGVIIDWSLKQYEPSGFYGLGVSAGIWADPNSTVVPAIGIFGGYIESKLNDSTVATGEFAITLNVKKTFMEDRLAASAYFAHGTHNYQDIGLRVGYDIWNNGIYTGINVSRMMHYGIAIVINMGNKK